jgi:hypothetical protein
MSISIQPGQWRKIHPDECGSEDILIEGLGAGLGIFVYDPQSRVTFAGHFAAPEAEHVHGLSELLELAVSEFSDRPLVRIHVSGCAEQDHESWDKTGALPHRLVEAELRKWSRPNQHKDFRWPRPVVMYSEMSLYPESGAFECGFRW